MTDGVTVRVLSDADPIAFAGSEARETLNRCLDGPIELQSVTVYDADEEGLWIGPRGAFPDHGLPDVSDPDVDDAIRIEAGYDGGIVTGTNPRSVLLGVYRYLREIGCTWVRPGQNGAVYPDLNDLPEVSVAEAAAYRHRGFSVGGGVPLERTLDLIDWAPKVGYNTAMIEFFPGEIFQLDRRRRGEALLPEDIAVDRHRRCLDAIERRGLVLHGIGHGWTARVLDVPTPSGEWVTDIFRLDGAGEQRVDRSISDDRAHHAAHIDGERGLYEGVPINTELCYSSPETRNAMIDEVVEYANDRPEYDVLHVWLADGYNNHCECPDCRERRPADWYVRLLNELDTRLHEHGVDQHVALLVYADLLWPPVEETIENAERFTLMFAPISRTYEESYESVVEPTCSFPPYERNEIELPSGVEKNVAFLERWQEVFDGDSFVFDYHFWLEQYRDLGEIEQLDTIGADVRGLDAIGLNGLVHCNLQRSFFPTGIGMTVAGVTLWNPDGPASELVDKYFAAAFGDGAEHAERYLRAVSARFDGEYVRTGGSPENPTAAADFEQLIETIRDVRPIIERNRGRASGVRERSWTILAAHADLCEALARAFAAHARGENRVASRQWDDITTLLESRSDVFEPILDRYWFEQVYETLFETDG